MPTYMNIKQGREESFAQFVDTVSAAIDQTPDVQEWIKGALLRQCLLQNCNPATRTILALLPDAHVPRSRANEEQQNNQQVDEAAKIGELKIDLDCEHKGELFLARWAHDASGHQDAHVPRSRANEEQQNNQQVDEAAKIGELKIDLDCEHKGELFLARWAHDASGHQGRDATYKWAQDRGVDLIMDSISQVIRDCEACAAIKQAKQMKPLWYGGWWSKYKYGETWQIDYITLPQTHQGKRHVLTMVEATTGWLETHPVSHATARNTILDLEKQVLWSHSTPERIESDNGTHFKNNLIKTWARKHGIEWVYHIPYHAPATGKVERYNGLLKTILKALDGGVLKKLGAAFSKGHLVR
ncbi:hypothetical protein HGM15179_020368 [Zosterops borbonicus]|uniref:Integrase catalytic domain-containing protein n=1 Tax=Zosterops borbonicus TaxID=364589 RepID=A0A8K1D9V1_9PASS|nr:hypothetical protein HGM15179_021580 [Zosterops borbonicus]TRZ06739.1 hypothetical protein HGM15179_020368 [Zosterops borbonicus]